MHDGGCKPEQLIQRIRRKLASKEKARPRLIHSIVFTILFVTPLKPLQELHIHLRLTKRSRMGPMLPPVSPRQRPVRDPRLGVKLSSVGK